MGILPGDAVAMGRLHGGADVATGRLHGDADVAAGRLHGGVVVMGILHETDEGVGFEATTTVTPSPCS